MILSTLRARSPVRPTWRGAVLAIAIGATLYAADAAHAATRRTFDTPDAAVAALFDAVVSGDRRELRPLFGDDTARVAPIPDDETMAAVRDAFVLAWRSGHSVEPRDANHAVLVIGSERFPYPVQMTRGADGRWSWDTAAGLREIASRRIGRNELATMQVLRAYVAAQHEYARADRDGDGVAEYARRLESRPGRRDGLYWEAAQGEPQPPLGRRVAAASDGATRGTPYHGYLFRPLSGQGAAARGGAFDYLVGARLLRGFGAIAIPAEYGRSGVSTFIVNHDGRVWSRDLGPGTASEAARIKRFDPVQGWKPEY